MENARKDMDMMAMDNDNEVLSIYLAEINRIPLISHEEEYELALKAKSGDRAAREKLLNANLRFVVSVAKKFRGQGLPLSDLINEGNIGLITALDKFEPEKGYHFISYAVWWIRQAIMKAISEKGRTVRLPLNRANELMQIQKAMKTIIHDKETADPSIEEIAEATGLDSALVSDLLSISQDVVSIDSPVRRGEESDTALGEFIEDAAGDMPYDDILRYCLPFYSGAVFTVFVTWLEEGMRETPEEMASLFHRMMKGAMEAVASAYAPPSPQSTSIDTSV